MRHIDLFRYLFHFLLYKLTEDSIMTSMTLLNKLEYKTKANGHGFLAGSPLALFLPILGSSRPTPSPLFRCLILLFPPLVRTPYFQLLTLRGTDKHPCRDAVKKAVNRVRCFLSRPERFFNTRERSFIRSVARFGQEARENKRTSSDHKPNPGQRWDITLAA